MPGKAGADGPAAAEAPEGPAPYDIELIVRMEIPLAGRLSGCAISQDFVWGWALGQATGEGAAERVEAAACQLVLGLRACGRAAELPVLRIHSRQLGRLWHVAHAPEPSRQPSAGNMASV